MTFEEKVKEALDEDITYYKNKIERLKESFPTACEIAHKLEEYKEQAVYSYVSPTIIQVKFNTIEEARKVVADLLSTFDYIPAFKKMLLSSYGDTPAYGFYSCYKHICIQVEPSDAPTDCTAVKKYTTIGEWSCELKGA